MPGRADVNGPTKKWRMLAATGAVTACAFFGAPSCTTEYTRAVASAQPAASPSEAPPAPASEAVATTELKSEPNAPSATETAALDGVPRPAWARSATVIEEAPAPIGMSKDVERAARFAGLTLMKGAGADLALRVAWSAEPTTSFDAKQSIVRWVLTVTAIDEHHQATVDSLALHGSAAAPKPAAANVEAEHAARIELSRRIDTFIRHVLADH